MSALLEAGERRRSSAVAATVNEAAFVTGISRHAVNQAIDRREIRTLPLRRKTDLPGRAVGEPELVYLRLHIYLSPIGRRELYRHLSGLPMDKMPHVLELGDLKVDLGDALAYIAQRVDELNRIKDLVEMNPEIRGGEPVFRGTRIPVRMIADFVGAGVPREELLEDYPALTEESLQIATRYVELYPRRGRPRQAPWRAGEPTHVFRAEELRDGDQ